MAGSFAIQFQRGGNPIPTSQFHPNAEPAFERGIVLDDESSAFPRPLSLNLFPLDPGTKARWENTQRRNGWVNRYDMDMTKVGDGIRFEGTDGAPCPRAVTSWTCGSGNSRLSTRNRRFPFPARGPSRSRLTPSPPPNRSDSTRPWRTLTTTRFGFCGTTSPSSTSWGPSNG